MSPLKPLPQFQSITRQYIALTAEANTSLVAWRDHLALTEGREVGLSELVSRLLLTYPAPNHQRSHP